jgi:pyruvate,orthophosphate dikinase
VYAAVSGRARGPVSGHDKALGEAVTALLAHADRRRRLRVRANAETEHEAVEARALGAEGIGLCRTEHMLLGARRELVERVVVDDGRADALAQIEAIAREDFTTILSAMDGLPVVVRLLDPPLHEFLPDLVELTAEAAAQGAVGDVDPKLTARLAAVRRWHEANPMLGLRGVRLLTVLPELVDAHMRALAHAASSLAAVGRSPRPEVMVPLVADVAELTTALGRVESARSDTDGTTPAVVDLPVGVMIELPRAALTAGALAGQAQFFSFGTNDLTQTTWGMSRDDAEASFLTAYRTQGVVEDDPFTRLDETGVGELVRIAVARGRAARPDLELGACGEHAGDPRSIHFFEEAGLDYVSCSPPRVPVARLEAGRAVVLASSVGATHGDTR